MATYDPPQPLWKRNLAGILDFLLAGAIFWIPLYRFFGIKTVATSGDTWTVNYTLSGVGSTLLLILIIGYFVVLGRTGGTVFQRLFRMRRVR